MATTMQRIEYRVDRSLSRAGIDYMQIHCRVGRAPAKLCTLVAAIAQSTVKTTSTVAGRVASSWGIDR